MKKIIILFMITLFLFLPGIPGASTHTGVPPSSKSTGAHRIPLKDGGGTLYSLALGHYQKADETLFDLILQANPAISDVRTIDGEQIVTMPQITAASYCTALRDGTCRIHIGTFETYALAAAYAKNLKDADKKLFIEPRAFSSRDTWYRLSMGDYAGMEEALQQAQHLAERGILFISRTIPGSNFAQGVTHTDIIPRKESPSPSPSPSPATEGDMNTRAVAGEQGLLNKPNDIPDGTIKEYYDNGRVKTIKNYAGGVPHGPSRVYYETGGPMFSHTYSKGRKDGLSRWYYRNGTVKYEYEYSNGTLDGMVRKYYQSGKREAQWTYRNGKREGKTTSYTRGGSIKAEWNYQDDTLDGISRIFNDSGGIQYIDTYKKGRKINRKAYDSRGKIIFEQNYPVEDDSTPR